MRLKKILKTRLCSWVMYASLGVAMVYCPICLLENGHIILAILSEIGLIFTGYVLSCYTEFVIKMIEQTYPEDDD